MKLATKSELENVRSGAKHNGFIEKIVDFPQLELNQF